MNILITIFKAILVFGFTLTFLFGLVLAHGAWRTQYYVSGVGTVVDAKVTERTTVDNDLAYCIEITMKYEVDGTMYERRPSFSSRTGLQTREDYERELKEHPIGARLEIFYDPQYPTTYTLHGESGSHWWSCAAILVVPSLAAIATMIWGW